MKTIDSDPNTPKPITTAGVETFLAAGNPSLNLLRVEPGVPIDAAYEHVSILMGYIKHLVREGDMEDDHKFLGAADYLCDMAKALMNDIEIAKGKAN
ncbi:DUF3077 domain-containing protein [Pseudomonas putida]|uniref:DUF3077 domain-containing protein n=1 Tax=Pseudomonas TaxID=286 RepID=UPI000CD3AD1C|nr:DUF3077 domain-containing protein [Pseudomonas putida]MCG3643126.1 DUF3077 domain-containing protein [Pseudomonas putida]POF86235.1 hypothetical protein BGP81_28095 [Pseudomonas putida]TFW25355.1 DUF3077 domain-containing protein [Pseudomonas putida]